MSVTVSRRWWIVLNSICPAMVSPFLQTSDARAIVARCGDYPRIRVKWAQACVPQRSLGTMGLFRDFRREFIVRPDAFKASILFKWPDTNIRSRTQLTVEQDELAVFFRDGKVSGVIQPGVSTLDSSEIPFLGDLVDAATGGKYFKTELYFVSTREFANLPF